MRPAPTSSDYESLNGIIERVTYFNEDNGFAVLRVKVKGHRELVTVVGTMASVSAGEWLHAEGRWVQDREHGPQLRAHLLTGTPPTTREGIEKYLGSGMVKGIGPVYAKKLVAHFGEKVLDIIETCSARLEEVDGIGPGRRRRIKEAWAEQRCVREIMVFLHSHGVSTSRAVRIFKTYGESAIEKVRENPYILARDIQGIGFKTADQIAERMGIPRDSLCRAAAGLLHLLLEGAGAGHCALPRTELIESAAKLLSLDPARIIAAHDRLISDREIIEERVGELDLDYLPPLRQAEVGVASRIRELAASRTVFPPVQIDRAIQWCERGTGKTLAPSQREALERILAARVIAITGGPGVGKTTLTNFVLKILRAKGVTCLLCAPTGRAAKRLAEATGQHAQTIHRLLKVQPGAEGPAHTSGPSLNCELLLVDECSMVDVVLMHQVLKALPPRAALILVGDADQLPSVGPGRVFGELIESGTIRVVRLTEVFRQAAQSRIITSAHQINRGILPDTAPREEESDFYFIERQSPEAILETAIEMAVRRIPRKLECDPVRDVQVLAPMHRGLLGVRELNLRLQAILNPLGEGGVEVEKFGWRFHAGDKVVQTVNNYEKDVFNGDVGQIARIDPEERQAVIRFDQREVVYDWTELDEVSLAYATTIHKSQGSEFPAVVIPLAMQHYLMLQRNLLYTGITRGRRMVVVVGQRKAFELAVGNRQTAKRYSGLMFRLRGGAEGTAPFGAVEQGPL